MANDMGKLCLPKFSLFDENENDTDNKECTPSLYNELKDTVEFKLKCMKRDRELKAEMKERQQKRQQRLAKINKLTTVK